MSTVKHMGPYEILETLGEGGMGIVYRARHKISRKIVALKTVKAAHEGVLRSIRKEISALANIRHPGIVQIFEHGLAMGLPWYAMEMLEGQNLRQWRQALIASSPGPQDSSQETISSQAKNSWWTQTLSFENTLSQSQTLLQEPSVPTRLEKPFLAKTLSEISEKKTVPSEKNFLYPPVNKDTLLPVLTMVYRICAPLAYLHGEGILHRDLKPENILVTPDGRPVLVDFGLANLLGTGGKNSRESLSFETGAFGTAYYVSTEQIRGEPLDARTDLYSLGILLFELLCGQRPFWAKNFQTTLLAHLFEAPPRSSKLVPHLPPEIDSLLERLLEKDKQNRPGYAEDIARILQSLGVPKEETLPTPRLYLYRPRFAGREKQLSWLKNQVYFSRQGKGGLILLGGKSGVGKTRLAMEVVREASKKNGKVFVGECEDGPVKVPLFAFRNVLQAIADRCLTRGEEETERILGASGPVLAAYESSLQKLPGQEKYAPPEKLSFDNDRKRLFLCLNKTFIAFSKGSSLVLVLDDLQWADELSIQFLHFFLAQKTLALSPLILATYRSEEQNEELEFLRKQSKVKHLEVDKLQEEAVAQMLGDMLALTTPPRMFSRFLTKYAEGNPFFVAEYLRTAVEEGLIWRNENGKWQVAENTGQGTMEADYEKLALPQSLRSLLTRWLQGLTANAREWVEAAAVLGREVSWELLERVGPNDQSGFHELFARQVFEPPRIGWVKFAHDKLRESTLEKISPEQKSRLHQRAAKAIEETLGAEENEGILGYHWEQAKKHKKAKQFYRIGANKALQNYSYQKAEYLYRSYLKLQNKLTKDRLDIQLVLGEHILQIQGKNLQALRVYQKATQEAQKLGNQTIECIALRLQGEIYTLLGKRQESQNFYQKALETAKLIGNRKEEGILLGNLAVIPTENMQIAKAQFLYQKALSIHREVGNRKDEGIVLGNLAILYQMQNAIEKAKIAYQQALSIHQEVGNRQLEGTVRGNLANLLQTQGDLEEAKILYQQALSIHRKVSSRREEGVVLGNLANLLQMQGDWESAKSLYQKALTIHRKTGYRKFEAVVLGDMASLFQTKGDWNSAKSLYQESIDIYHKIGNFRLEGMFLGILGDLQRQTEEDLQKSVLLLTQAETLLEPTNDPIELAKIFCNQGHLCLAQGNSAHVLLEKIKKTLSHNTSPELDTRLTKLKKAQKLFLAKEHKKLFRGEILAECTPILTNWWKKKNWLPKD